MEFAVVFALIWIAWTNGSLYLELHGREDGRTRAFVFLQIGILALVAVFAANAANDGGRAFALVYAAFLVVMTWLWYEVQRQDRVERPEFVVVTSRYVTGLVLSVVVMLVSGFLPAGPRLMAWAALAGGWILLVLLHSDGWTTATWMVSHFPITLSIAAAGAGMIGLIEHAHGARTPAPMAWLLTGAVAVGLLAVIVAANALADARRLAAAYHPLTAALAAGAAAALVVGWARPAPWLLAVLLVVILTVLWAVAVRGFLLANAWGEEPSSLG